MNNELLKIAANEAKALEPNTTKQIEGTPFLGHKDHYGNVWVLGNEEDVENAEDTINELKAIRIIFGSYTREI